MRISDPPKSVYVAEKMRGIEHYNFPWFDAARDYLRSLGVAVVSPADEDRAEGFNELTDPFSGTDLLDAIRRDVGAILHVDAIALGPQWRTSVGATAEYHVAKWAQKQVWFVDPCVPYFYRKDA